MARCRLTIGSEPGDWFLTGAERVSRGVERCQEALSGLWRLMKGVSEEPQTICDWSASWKAVANWPSGAKLVPTRTSTRLLKLGFLARSNASIARLAKFKREDSDTHTGFARTSNSILQVSRFGFLRLHGAIDRWKSLSVGFARHGQRVSECTVRAGRRSELILSPLRTARTEVP